MVKPPLLRVWQLATAMAVALSSELLVNARKSECVVRGRILTWDLRKMLHMLQFTYALDWLEKINIWGDVTLPIQA